MWGSNSQPWDQELHALPTESARCPDLEGFFCFLLFMDKKSEWNMIDFFFSIWAPKSHHLRFDNTKRKGLGPSYLFSSSSPWLTSFSDFF